MLWSARVFESGFKYGDVGALEFELKALSNGGVEMVAGIHESAITADIDRMDSTRGISGAERCGGPSEVARGVASGVAWEVVSLVRQESRVTDSRRDQPRQGWRRRLSRSVRWF